MFYKKYLDMNNYSDDSVYSIDAPQSAQHTLTKLIEQFQIMQFSDEIWNEQAKTRDVDDVIAKVQAFEATGQNPIIISLWGITNSDELVKHAVVPYRVETISSNEYHMYIYDCNYPYDEKSGDEIYIDIVNGKFEYGDYTMMKYNDLNTMLTGLNDVTLFSDENEETMLLTVNSNDVTITNKSGIVVEQIVGAVSYPIFNDSGNSNGTIWNLPVDDYTITNNDTSLETFDISVADEICYYKLSSEDVSANINIGISSVTDKLSVEVISSKQNTLQINTLNNQSMANTMQITSDYSKFGYCNDKSVIVNSNAETITANDTKLELNEVESLFKGLYGDGVNMMTISEKMNNAQKHNCEITITDKPKLLNDELVGNLKLAIENNSEIEESGTLYVGVYDTNSGRLIDITSQQANNIEVGTKREVNMDIDVSDQTDGEYEIKVFYWNNEMIPLSLSANVLY